MTIAQQLNIKKFPFIIKDDEGYEIYFESHSGFWVKQEWADGKITRYEDVDGYWEKREWVNGKVTRYEDAAGYWEKREWVDGKEIYFENSLGRIRDNRRLSPAARAAVVPRPKTDVQKAIDLLTKEGLIVGLGCRDTQRNLRCVVGFLKAKLQYEDKNH